MNNYILGCLLASIIAMPISAQVQILNPSFEQGLEGWTVKSEGEKAVYSSDEGHDGAKSAKITAKNGILEQTVIVTPGQHYELSTHVKGAALLGVKVGGKIYFDRMSKKKKWAPMRIKFNTDEASQAIIFASFNGDVGRFDDFSLKSKGAQAKQELSPNVVSKSAGGTGLSADLAPGQNFDLTQWYLSVPTDRDNNGKSDSIWELELAKGYEDARFFYTGDDGGMVFKVPVDGAKTSTNTNYTRTELREMLRRGDKSIKTHAGDTPNKNNWVFSTAPRKAQKQAGAIDGVLEAKLAVNHVTTTGARNEIGRVIIGQIHAKDDEPIRLYYRKLPGNKNGSIYAAHESKAKADDIYYEMIGTRASSAPNPPNGFALDEKFSYKIDAKGHVLDVTIYDGGGAVRAQTTIDMMQSGYDVSDEYMYFKAGVYNQNKTGRADDYVQATFYKLKVTH